MGDSLRPLGAPRRLVALPAPAGAPRDGDPAATRDCLEALGYRVHLPAHAGARHRYLAGTVQQRLDDLHEVFGLAQATAIWCLRGGYGSAQLIEGIDWTRLGAVPLLGYSDISALLSALHRRGHRAIHAPVASELRRIEAATTDEEARARRRSMNAIAEVLAGEPGAMPAEHASGPETPVQGVLIGGNLTTLASLAGTPAALYAPPESLLLLEDVGETPYRLERSFRQLMESLPVGHLAGVALGSFTHCTPEGAQVIAEVATEWLAPQRLPLYHRLPFGHSALNLPWPVGRKARLGQGRLVWQPEES